MIDKLLWEKTNTPGIEWSIEKNEKGIFFLLFAELMYLSRNAHNTTTEPTIRFIAKKRSALYRRMNQTHKIDNK